MEEKAKASAKEFIKYGYNGLDLLYGVMAAVLEDVTKYSEVLSPKGPLSTKGGPQRPRLSSYHKGGHY